MSSTAPAGTGTVCDQCGRPFPHLGYQPAPGVTKWFCNRSCKTKWLRSSEQKPPIKIEMGRVKPHG